MFLLLSLHQTRRRSNRHRAPAALSELREGEHGVLEDIELAGDDAQRMMELGFIPGAGVTAGRSAPGGDPRVYRVDGSEVALRRETASRLKLRRRNAAAD
jgi:ferrous iron transport protein A